MKHIDISSSIVKTELVSIEPLEDVNNRRYQVEEEWLYETSLYYLLNFLKT